MATAALVCGIAGLVLFFLLAPAVVAVVLGAVAVARARATPGTGDGRGRATAGLVCGIIGVALFVGMVALAIVQDWGDDEVASNDLEVGQCVEFDVTATEVSTLPVVDCDRAHQGEVFFVGDPGFAGSDFPGDEAVARRAEDRCTGDAFEEYVGTRYLRSELEVSTIHPLESSWRLGDRIVVCLAVRPDGGDLHRSIRGSGI
jgi:hypothetical protein